jgi:hypothetical protein
MKYRLAFIVIAGFLLVGGICDTVPDREWERGFFTPIQTEPYKLPGDLNVFRIVGYDDEIETSPWPLQMNVRNDGDRRVTDVMPAGLVFSPSGIDYAYMILLQEFTITVPALKDTVILIPTYSCNEDLDEPDDESNYFTDNRAWDVELKEMYDLLEGKTLHDSIVGVDEIQDALWEITDGEGLTDSTRNWLRGLK